MRTLGPTAFRGLGINMLTRRGKLDATGGSARALPERDVFSGGYICATQLVIGVGGPVTTQAGKISYRIGQDLTAASVAAPESSQQIQGSTAHEIGDSPDSALSLSLSGFLVMLGVTRRTRTPESPYRTGERKCLLTDRGEVSMRQRGSYGPGSLGVAAIVAAFLVWPVAGEAQTVTGQARAVQATVFSLLGGTTTVLADTGALSGPSTALHASALTGNVPSLLTGETLHATTIGWPDQVASEASLGSLALSVAGTIIGADAVMARARAVLGRAGAGTSDIANLSINGVPIPVSGAPNQTIFIPGGRVVINEQQTSLTSTVVNALHVIVDGVADVVIGSATAGIN